MRKDYLSVFTLYIRMTYKKILAILMLMTVLETALIFTRGMNESSFSAAAYRAGLPFVTGLAIIITSFLLLFCCGSGSKAVYTLARLKLSLNKVFCTVLTYFTLVFILFWFAQAFVLFMLSRYFAANAPQALETPYIFLSFAISRYLMLFIPVRGWILYIANTMWILFISSILATSHFDLIRGRKKGTIAVLVPGILAYISGLVDNPMVFSIYVIAILFVAIILNLMINGRFNSAEAFSFADKGIEHSISQVETEGGTV